MSQSLMGFPTAVPTLAFGNPFGERERFQRTSRQSRPMDCLPFVQTGVLGGSPALSPNLANFPKRILD
ncbi:hypothetical protein [Nostoc sp. 106C]